jgi:hypothetical protein
MTTSDSALLASTQKLPFSRIGGSKTFLHSPLPRSIQLFAFFHMGDEADVKGGQPWRFDIRIVSLDDLPQDVEGVAVLWAKGEVSA